MSKQESKHERSSLARVPATALVGLLGAVFIWWATPYNNYLFKLGPISESYLPIGALFLIFLVCVVVNPLLRRFRPGGAFDRRQLVILVTIWLMASVVPGQGLMRFLPFMLGRAPIDVSALRDVADMHEQMDLPPSLFPDKMEFGARVDNAVHFIQQLPAGESVPWAAWLPPLLTWGCFFLFAWMFMMGLSMIVYPQWRDNERLPFPLLSVYEAHLDEPPPGRFLPAAFRERGFWVGAGTVLVLYLFYGLNAYFPSKVPCIPLQWNVESTTRDTILQYFPPEVFLRSRLYFVLIGIAFLMPSRIGFSIWFTTVAYGVGIVLRTVYFPPYYEEAIEDHRTGCVLAMTVFILWLGRQHWLRVLRAMAGRLKSVNDARYGRAGWLFVIGFVGACAWLVWVGVQLVWAVAFVALAAMSTLIMARLVAETGLPFIRLHRSATPDGLLLFVPSNWVNIATVFFSVILHTFFIIGTRVQPAVMATHALGLQRRRPGEAPATSRGLLMLGVLLLGFVIAGAVMVQMGYHHSAPLKGSPPLSEWGTRRIGQVHQTVRSFERGHMDPSARYSQPRAILFGATLAGGLQWACLNVPKWPLHPVGILVVRNFYGQHAFTSIFIGWLLKVLVLRIGGARMFRRAHPLFMGLIIGEVVAAIAWGAVAGSLAAFGMEFQKIIVQP